MLAGNRRSHDRTSSRLEQCNVNLLIAPCHLLISLPCHCVHNIYLKCVFIRFRNTRTTLRRLQNSRYQVYRYFLFTCSFFFFFWQILFTCSFLPPSNIVESLFILDWSYVFAFKCENIDCTIWNFLYSFWWMNDLMITILCRHFCKGHLMITKVLDMIPNHPV
jgi:hypothetical protein